MNGEPHDEADAWRSALSRRRFVAATGAVAGVPAAVSGGGAAATDTAATPEEDTDDVAVHDHSLGNEGGPNLRPRDLATAETPVVDVRAHGVVGDGETDDAVAFQRAVDAATPNGVLYVPHDVVLHFESPVDVPLDNAGAGPSTDQSKFAFVCDGVLNPAPGLGTAVHVHDGSFPYLQVRVAGGGAPEDVAVRVTDVFYGVFDGFASGYGGTVYRIDTEEAVLGQSWSVGTLQTTDCYQSLVLDGVAGIGEISHVHDRGSVKLPEFRNATDLSINRVECVADPGRTEQGLVISGGASLWVDTVEVTGVPGITNVTVGPRTFANLDRVITRGGDVGLLVNGANIANFGRVVARDNEVGVEFRAGIFDHLTVDARGNAGPGLVVDPGVNGFHTVTGTVADNGAPAVLDPNEAAIVSVVDATVARNGAPADPDLVVADGKGDAVELWNVRGGDVAGDPRLVDRVGTATGDGATPDAGAWGVGEVVEFTSDADPDATGLYLRGPDGTWARLD